MNYYYRNVKPKRTFGQKVLRFLKITAIVIGGTFFSLMAFGIYLGEQALPRRRMPLPSTASTRRAR